MSEISTSVTAPGSTANLGPGFDVLGLAIDLRAEVGVGPIPSGARAIDESHPGAIAYRLAGGLSADLWSRSRLPMGRGLGYSGAVRAAGAMLAIVESEGPDSASDARSRDQARLIASDLEGHPDNAAASVHGGLVVAAPTGEVTPVPIGFDPAVLVWIPDTTTSTDQSRTRLSDKVERVDTVANLAAMANLIVGVLTGDRGALKAGCEDRIHQPSRLAGVPQSANVLEQLLDLGAMAAWLSGSGPTVAAFVERSDIERIGASLKDGVVRVLEIDSIGVSVDISM
ncbi:homoserine kinase [Ilumatobacteraceae bacterium]|nr:homoserine kinase [Ilumatobacteraceae bacterium]